MKAPSVAGIELKVVVAALTAYLLPAVDSFLGLLIEAGVDISPGLRSAMVEFVSAQLPVIVFLVAYATPHTHRPDVVAARTDGSVA